MEPAPTDDPTDRFIALVIAKATEVPAEDAVPRALRVVTPSHVDAPLDDPAEFNSDNASPTIIAEPDAAAVALNIHLAVADAEDEPAIANVASAPAIELPEAIA